MPSTKSAANGRSSTPVATRGTSVRQIHIANRYVAAKPIRQIQAMTALVGEYPVPMMSAMG